MGPSNQCKKVQGIRFRSILTFLPLLREGEGKRIVVGLGRFSISCHLGVRTRLN